MCYLKQEQFNIFLNEDNGTYHITGLPKGYYFAQYYLEDGYTAVGNKIFFQVGDDITQLMINKTIYNLNENIMAHGLILRES